MAFRNLTTVDILYCIMCEGPAWLEIHSSSIQLRTRSHMTSRHTWGPATTLHDLESELGGPLDTFLLGSHNFMVTALRVKPPKCLHFAKWSPEIKEVHFPVLKIWRRLNLKRIYEKYLIENKTVWLKVHGFGLPMELLINKQLGLCPLSGPT